jgi:hypothetical protein
VHVLAASINTVLLAASTARMCRFAISCILQDITCAFRGIWPETVWQH